MLHNLHVRLGPVTFAELPHVDDVAVEDDRFCLDGFEIAKEFFRVTAVGAEVNIREND